MFFVKRGEAKYCSQKCFHKIKGFQKGYIPWNKGKRCPNLTKAHLKTGKAKIAYNYIGIYQSPRKYILEHRIIMEKHLKRPLHSKEVVHHIDGNTTNNHINNLMLFPNQATHQKFHRFIHHSIHNIK